MTRSTGVALTLARVVDRRDMFADKALRCDCGHEVRTHDEAARVEEVGRHVSVAHGINPSVDLALEVVRRARLVPSSEQKTRWEEEAMTTVAPADEGDDVMGIERKWTIGTGAATVAAVLAIGAGVTLGQGGASASQDADIGTVDATTCVLGPEPAGPAAPPWMDGLMARSDGLNRQHHLGRYAPGGPCADVPDWLRALILRSDAMNRAGNLGRYAPTR